VEKLLRTDVFANDPDALLDVACDERREKWMRLRDGMGKRRRAAMLDFIELRGDRL
jgi:hypothetical protein